LHVVLTRIQDAVEEKKRQMNDDVTYLLGFTPKAKHARTIAVLAFQKIDLVK
jgi:hypothetical protein